ncbi:hypothetical protein PEPMIC_00225 [Parvimonas micra ATCC 33270]|uniref:Uncharacterized protein n=1 Tax=Parvimonas micra ATCC 33270 TaxID=411465 RepID=A8SIW5_9FIRM|nr:hypothetical protein PEPMIC_00225 [Parvimonas micra ATCC 33270]
MCNYKLYAIMDLNLFKDKFKVILSFFDKINNIFLGGKI